MDKEFVIYGIGQRIKCRRETIGMSQQELADRVGYKSRSSINKIEMGKNDIVQSTIRKIADALDCTPAYLMGWDEDRQNLPSNILPLPKMKKVPLLGTIACGEPILAEENIEGFLAMPENVGADFCLRCKGDSMINARIFDGDIVYVRQQETVENGEIAAVMVGEEEATLKRVHFYPGCISLDPENPLYTPIIKRGADMEQVRILGKAVAFVSTVI